MELQIVTFLQHLGQGTFVDSISWFVSWMPFLVVLGALIVGALCLKFRAQRKRILVSFAIAGALFYVISELGFKTLLVDQIGFRERPYVAYSGTIVPIGLSYDDTSFPSSHMALTLAMMTLLVLFAPTLWPVALVFVMMMAFSRMHNGMHYPSDVLVGAALGIVYGWMGFLIAKKLDNR